MKKNKEFYQVKDSFIGLAGTVLGIYLGLVVLIMIFAKEFLIRLAIPLAWAFIVLGALLGLFQLFSLKKKRR